METIHQGDRRTTRFVEVLASYDITVTANKESVTSWAEVKPSPHGTRVDFSDDISDFLRANSASKNAWHVICELIFKHYSGEIIVVPFTL